MVIERDKRLGQNNQPDTGLSDLANLKTPVVKLTPENSMLRYPKSDVISFATEAEPAARQTTSHDSVPSVIVVGGPKFAVEFDVKKLLGSPNLEDDTVIMEATSPLIRHSTKGLFTRGNVPSSTKDPESELNQGQRELPTRIYLN